MESFMPLRFRRTTGETSLSVCDDPESGVLCVPVERGVLKKTEGGKNVTDPDGSTWKHRSTMHKQTG